MHIVLWTFYGLAVPCLRRAASVAEDYEAAGGEVLVDDEDNDGWLATHGKPKGRFCIERLVPPKSTFL